jgi:hypothetical protein
MKPSGEMEPRSKKARRVAPGLDNFVMPDAG